MPKVEGAELSYGFERKNMTGISDNLNVGSDFYDYDVDDQMRSSQDLIEKGLYDLAICDLKEALRLFVERVEVSSHTYHRIAHQDLNHCAIKQH